MVNIDLNSKKTLIFDTTNTEKIKSANFAVQLSNNVIYTYPGEINVNANHVIISIPVLKEMIKTETEGICYLELQDQDDKYYRVSKDTISFTYGKIIEVNFNSSNQEISAQYKNVNEIVVDSKNLKLTPINYKIDEGQKPLRREVILSM